MSTFQKTNKNIDNASGQVVREDIEATLKATAANNFGALDNAGTILPAEFVADNNTNPKRLLIRATSGGDQAKQLDENGNPASNAATFYEVGKLDQDNLGLLKRAGDTLTGSLQFINGVAGTPSINFGDTTTGLFKSATNAIGFSTAGTERVTIANSGLDMLGLPVRFRDSDGTPNFVSVQAPSDLTGDLTLKLPNAIVNGGFMRTDGNGQLSFQPISPVPTGVIFALPDTQAGGNDGYESDGIPTGYKHCNGDAISRSTFSALFAVIGTTYGAGDGSSTFNLPDLRGRFIRGVNTSNSGDDPNRAIGNLQSDDNKSHTHNLNTTTSTHNITGNVRKISETFAGAGTTSGVFSKLGNQDAPLTPGGPDTSPTGGFSINATHSHTINANTNSHGSESRPKNIAMMYIIKF